MAYLGGRRTHPNTEIEASTHGLLLKSYMQVDFMPRESPLREGDGRGRGGGGGHFIGFILRTFCPLQVVFFKVFVPSRFHFKVFIHSVSQFFHLSALDLGLSKWGIVSVLGCQK